MTFCSSRTLPFQGRDRRNAIAAVGQLRGAVRRLAVVPPVVAQEMVGEQRNVLGPLAQRRQVNRDHAQPVEEVAAQDAAAHGLLRIAVGRGDEAHVDHRVGLFRTRPGGPRRPE